MATSLTFNPHLQSRRLLLEVAAAQNRTVNVSVWVYLQDSEDQLIELMRNHQQPPGKEKGHIEYGWCLYYLNHDAPAWLTDVLKKLGLPPSRIQPDEWTRWLIRLAGNGVLAGDGSLISTAKYAALDLGWALALVDYFLVHLDLIHKHSFTQTGPAITITGKTSLTVAVFGDWGTGPYKDGKLPASPSQLVMQQIKQAAPDINIHLGDVYYSGTHGLIARWGEEYRNLVECWDYVAPSGNFTLNSNHEMYDGGNGLFNVALNPHITPIFKDQGGSTFFTISFGNWLIIGLDSAYNATKMFMAGAITDDYQKKVLQEAGASGKKIMIFTHHNPVSEFGDGLTYYDPADEYGEGTQSSLWGDVINALGKKPDYWYWGHIHNGIVYASSAAQGICEGTACRCLGNAAIPIGNASWFENNPNVDFYTRKSLNESYPGNNTLRVQNGYCILTFEEDTVTEQWYYQDGTLAWSPGQ
jgi:hypothetical protein